VLELMIFLQVEETPALVGHKGRCGSFEGLSYPRPQRLQENKVGDYINISLVISRTIFQF
jgi:hypothetical protein